MVAVATRYPDSATALPGRPFAASGCTATVILAAYTQTAPLTTPRYGRFANSGFLATPVWYRPYLTPPLPGIGLYRCRSADAATLPVLD